MAAEVERQFRAASPETFFVAARVLRRVLRSELEITSPLIRLPHRKTYVIDRDRLLWLVARDELGVEPEAVLPPRMMLISRPEEDRLSRFHREQLFRYYWQLTFHSRLDFHLQDAVASSRMTTAMLRERIDRIGQTEFDEVRAVLRQESLLMHPDDQRAVYAEFVAVWCELQTFAPGLLSLYFPSLVAKPGLGEVIEADCPSSELLRAVTPMELRGQDPAVPWAEQLQLTRPDATQPAAVKPLEWRCKQRIKRAKKFQEQGNSIRAALWYQDAAAVAPPTMLAEVQQACDRELDAFSRRLQFALELTDDLTATWRRIAAALAVRATTGFWNANTRLLYDLQKVCLDHERETYRLDLWKWLWTWGREPLRHPLPNQRIVLMSKHLYTATQRLGAVNLAPEDRTELTHLLHESAEAAERLLRRRLEPFLSHSLHDTGFVAESVVEEVAVEKLTQELLDGVVHRGFLTLGDLRDAVSRNQLKMPDLSGSTEFLAGDSLLQADRRFALLLDGVYQRGPLYLRWLQRMSSLFFGTVWGRNLTLYAALPYGIAFMAIRGAEHLVVVFQQATGQSDDEPADLERVDTATGTELASQVADDVPIEQPLEVPNGGDGHTDLLPDQLTGHEHHSLLTTTELTLSVLALGTIIFVLMHFPRIRAGVVRGLRIGWQLFRRIIFEWPLAILKFPPVAWLMRSLPVMLFRRYLLTPILLTFSYWKILPAVNLTEPPNRWYVLAFFTAAVVVFLTRLGRDTEELFWDWVGKTWYRVRVHLIVGLITLIIDVFRQVMDGVERVLYAVDEWLRFRTGESNVTLGIKAVLGAIWSVIHAVVRFAVTLLIEPQINPIKHFPVVTVSHKLLVFTLPPLAHVLSQFLGPTWGSTIATVIITGIPGIFGFLAWEFKENWKLYAANRPNKLKPVPIGSHGETMLRLLAPGFHSGTLPKLFAKRRRNARKARWRPELDRRAKFDEQLHHVTQSIGHFVERELLSLLQHSRAFREMPLSLGHVEASTNRVVIQIQHADAPEPLQILISEQSGWLIAGIADTGWAATRLDARQRRVLAAALAGMYKLGAVELVREQIESRLLDARPAYDISEYNLIVWPHRDFDKEIFYNLDERPLSTPRPRAVARTVGLGPLPLADLVFQEHDLEWTAWRKFWEDEQSASAVTELLEIRVLPMNAV